MEAAPQEASPEAGTASKAEMEAAPQEASPEVETAPVEDKETVEKKTPKDVAPTSDESDSAADTTPLKNPEEA
jgi:hypothetical protein